MCDECQNYPTGDPGWVDAADLFGDERYRGIAIRDWDALPMTDAERERWSRINERHAAAALDKVREGGP